MTYKDAGVNIDAGEALVEKIKPIAKKTYRPEVLTGLGGFGALFEIPVDRYQQPVLVSGTDGVGTKLKLAMQLKKHDSIGIDLVAMCANDVLAAGAEPLYFLDYYATGLLELEVATQVITGIGRGCELAGAALIGGETAEMPGMYSGGDYDLAGFCVGVVEKAKIITPDHVHVGDTLIALASSGLHSNGYSLVRNIVDRSEVDLSSAFDAHTLGDELLNPTRIYAKSILSLLKTIPAHGIAHITGGGLLENIPRILPDNTQAILDESSWEWPGIFRWLQVKGNVATEEMHRTFNCGVGMVIAVAAEHASQAIEHLQKSGEKAWQIGQVAAQDQQQARVIIR